MSALTAAGLTHVNSTTENALKIADCKVEVAQLSDAQDIMNIVNVAFKSNDFFRKDIVDGKPSDKPIESRLPNKEMVEEEIKNPKHKWLVVKTSQGKAIGAMRYTKDSVDQCSLHMLAKNINLKGIGTLLIAEAVRRAENDKMRNIQIDVIEKNAKLVKWYNGEHFVPTGKKFAFDWKPAMHSAYWGHNAVMCIELIRYVGKQVASAVQHATAVSSLTTTVTASK